MKQRYKMILDSGSKTGSLLASGKTYNLDVDFGDQLVKDGRAVVYNVDTAKRVVNFDGVTMTWGDYLKMTKEWKKGLIDIHKTEEEFIKHIRENKAIAYAKEKHKDQKYDNGTSYFDGHLKKTVDILKQVTDDIDIIIAGYLHDTVEDTDTTFTDIKNEFNPRVAGLVYEVTKVDGGFPNLKSQDAIIVKFADRLANISDMKVWSPNRQQSYLYKSRFW